MLVELGNTFASVSKKRPQRSLADHSMGIREEPLDFGHRQKPWPLSQGLQRFPPNRPLRILKHPAQNRAGNRSVEMRNHLGSQGADLRISIGSERGQLAVEHALVLEKGWLPSRLALRHFAQNLRRRRADSRMRVAQRRQELWGLGKREPSHGHFQRIKREMGMVFRD